MQCPHQPAILECIQWLDVVCSAYEREREGGKEEKCERTWKGAEEARVCPTLKPEHIWLCTFILTRYMLNMSATLSTVMESCVPIMTKQAICTPKMKVEMKIEFGVRAQKENNMNAYLHALKIRNKDSPSCWAKSRQTSVCHVMNVNTSDSGEAYRLQNACPHCCRWRISPFVWPQRQEPIDQMHTKHVMIANIDSLPHRWPACTVGANTHTYMYVPIEIYAFELRPIKRILLLTANIPESRSKRGKVLYYIKWDGIHRKISLAKTEVSVSVTICDFRHIPIPAALRVFLSLYQFRIENSDIARSNEELWRAFAGLGIIHNIRHIYLEQMEEKLIIECRLPTSKKCAVYFEAFLQIR